jgi:CRISPR-associated protein Csm2
MAIKHDFNPERAFNKQWVSQKIDELCIDFLENFGFYLCDKKNEQDKFVGTKAVTISQIRNIFGEIKRLEQKITDDEKFVSNQQSFLMLRPKIAYNTARVISNSRTKDSRIVSLRSVLEMAHKEVTNYDSFKRFSQILEGTIAYHKVYGGKE